LAGRAWSFYVVGAEESTKTLPFDSLQVSTGYNKKQIKNV
jgi:hypothetical protein